MSKIVNRKNNCTIHFMVNEEDMKELNRRFALTNFKNKREFYISGEFRKELRELSSFVSRNSVNMNQIAKAVNSTGVIYKKDIELIHSGLELELSFLAEFREKVSDYIINKVIS